MNILYQRISSRESLPARELASVVVEDPTQHHRGRDRLGKGKRVSGMQQPSRFLLASLRCPQTPKPGECPATNTKLEDLPLPVLNFLIRLLYVHRGRPLSASIGRFIFRHLFSCIPRTPLLQLILSYLSKTQPPPFLPPTKKHKTKTKTLSIAGV
jgi:hypothetical protein